MDLVPNLWQLLEKFEKSKLIPFSTILDPKRGKCQHIRNFSFDWQNIIQERVHEYKYIDHMGDCLILFTQILVLVMYVTLQGKPVCEHQASGDKSRFYNFHILQSINAEIDVSLI